MADEHVIPLFEAARAATRHSHSPYSKFPVGAALLAEDGSIHAGTNIEVAAYPEGWCAETSAISHLVMSGNRRIEAVAVLAEKIDVCTPCGGCRQRLAEFGAASTPVYLCNMDGLVQTVTLDELLPHAFELESVE